jgi:hypothetical protein
MGSLDMKWPLLVFFVCAAMSAINAQDLDQSTNSQFDNSEVRTYNPKSILVQGEVEAPGTVDLNSLPLRSVPIKELALENGKHVFKGAYFVSGYSLYDVLNLAKIKKAPGNTFKPPVDMYVIVENNKGEKAAFSWGEIYYRDSFDILITKTIQPINPARATITWPLPDEPRLVCGGDLLNVRFMSNPAKITVKSFFESGSAEKPKDIYSPEITISTKAGSATMRELSPSIGKRNNEGVLYGHGMGFKEVFNGAGYLLKDVLSTQAHLTADRLKSTIAGISAKDGYHVVFSASEIMNRSDNHDYLLSDLKDAANGGRYTLVVTSDFFADRDVRSLEKITLVDIE